MIEQVLGFLKHAGMVISVVAVAVIIGGFALAAAAKWPDNAQGTTRTVYHQASTLAGKHLTGAVLK